MNQTVFSIEHLGRIVTVKTCAGAIGAALGLYPNKRKGIRWEETEKGVTVINGGEIVVKEIHIPLSWVR